MKKWPYYLGCLGLALFIVFFSGVDLWAQLPPPMLPSAPVQAPIDGGLGLLIFGGGVYALRKLRKKS